MKIHTEHVFPPIPIRQFDWCAYDDDTYDGPGSVLGHGPTEQLAIADFITEWEGKHGPLPFPKPCCCCGAVIEIIRGHRVARLRELRRDHRRNDGISGNAKRMEKTMFKTEAQQCKAIRILLTSLNLERLWTDKGPSRQACDYLEGSPLSHGEQVMLRCAFDFWNGEGKVTLYRDLLGVLDSRRLNEVLTLAMASNAGGDAVEDWIESMTKPEGDVVCDQKERDARVLAESNGELLTALMELTGAVQDARRRHEAGDTMAIQSDMLRATMKQAFGAILKANR